MFFGRQRNINLPDFDLRGIVASPTLQPVDDFIATRDIMRQDYETAQDNLSKFEQARAALQSAPFEADQQALNDINARFDDRFQTVQGREDLENVLPTTTRILGEYGASATPIAQRRKQFDDLKQQIITDTKLGGPDKARAIEAIQRQERLNPTLQNIDGTLVNNFDPASSAFVFTPSANLFDIVDKAVSGAKTDIMSLPPEIRELKNSNGETVGEIIANQRIESLSSDQVRAIAENALTGNSDVEAYRQRERQFGELGLEDNFESQRTAAIDAAVQKYNVRRNIITSGGQFKRADGNDSGGGDIGNIRNTFRIGTSLPNDFQSIKNLRKERSRIAEAIASGQIPPQEARRLGIRKNMLDKFEQNIQRDVPSIAKEKGWSQADIELYNNTIDIPTEELSETFKQDFGRSTITGTGGTDEGFEAKRVLELRNDIDNFAEKNYDNLFNKSYSVEVADFAQTKFKDTGKTLGAELTETVKNDINSYNLVTQDGKSIEELLEELPEADKEKVTDQSVSRGTMAEIAQELTVNGVTTHSLYGHDVPALAGKLSSKYNELLGEQIYLVPKAGHRSGIYNLIAERGVGGSNAIPFRVLNALGETSRDIEADFNEYGQFKPDMFTEPVTINETNPSLPSVKVSNNGKGQYQYQIVLPDGTTSASENANDMSEIRNSYYTLIYNLSRQR